MGSARHWIIFLPKLRLSSVFLYQRIQLNAGIWSWTTSWCPSRNLIISSESQASILYWKVMLIFRKAPYLECFPMFQSNLQIRLNWRNVQKRNLPMSNSRSEHTIRFLVKLYCRDVTFRSASSAKKGLRSGGQKNGPFLGDHTYHDNLSCPPRDSFPPNGGGGPSR